MLMLFVALQVLGLGMYEEWYKFAAGQGKDMVEKVGNQW